MHKDLAFSQDLAHQAGVYMRRSFGSVLHKTKLDGSAITPVDTAINRLVIAAVTSTFPEDSVSGEELSHYIKGARRTWVCDPIDGTLPYVLGIPTNVFSLALVQDGEPKVAVVFDPYLNRLYWAVKGEGAFLNKQRLRVSEVSSLPKAIVANSGRTSPFVRMAEFKRDLEVQCRRLLTIHSVIYEAMLVASGAIEATILMNPGYHNAASAKLIVEEAGGLVTGLFGENQRYDQPLHGALISNSTLHPTLVAQLDRHRQTNTKSRPAPDE